MACCCLCRPKVKPTIKTNKNITANKINSIDTWIENIEGYYELIELPAKPPGKPKAMTNTEEIAEPQKSDSSDNSTSTEQDNTNPYDSTVFNRKVTSRKQNLRNYFSEV